MGKTPHDNADQAPKPQRTSFLLAALTSVMAVVLFFALLEGGLALFGVQSVLHKDDPFVGFSGNVPLYIPSSDANGRAVLVTSPAKYTYFNPQQFPREKGANTYRIFSLGGSTTYGHIYNDVTSFSGWLRELLPAADSSRQWEVINAGGISYASYRVAHLMEELVQYQPDLFIIYTGHNEFLEERTYGALRDVPEVVKTTVGVLAKTRTWAAMNSALTRVGLVPEAAQPQRAQLSAEVSAVLDKSAGLEYYRRDDALRDDIVTHFRVSLERMVEIARAAGAQVIFVTPAANLKDFSPFKSEHSAGLDTAGQQRSETLLTTAQRSMLAKAWPAALAALDEAITLDPRFAELHFQRGRVLFSLGRFDEAYSAFQRARDEDVCPLRALTPILSVVADVARAEKVALVDYATLLESQLLDEKGHRIPGDESFLDHVHPTIEGNRFVATALVQSLIDNNIVHPGPAWPEQATAAATARVEARIDPHLQATSLLNLSKTLSWARKFDDARRAGRQALVMGRNFPDILPQVSHILVNLAREEKDAETAERYTREAIAADPGNTENRIQLGLRLLGEKRGKEGAAQILLAAALSPDSSEANSLLGQVLFENRHYEIAYPYLKKSLQLNPRDEVTQQAFTLLRKRLGPAADALPLPPIVIRRYPSGAAQEVFLASSGTPDGFYSEWFEDGNLQRFAEYDHGRQHGVDLRWNQEGHALR